MALSGRMAKTRQHAAVSFGMEGIVIFFCFVPSPRAPVAYPETSRPGSAAPISMYTPFLGTKAVE